MPNPNEAPVTASVGTPTEIQSVDITDMIPWPKDLNELVGKRITTRMNKAHHLHAALGDRAETCEVTGIVVDDPDWLVVSMSPSGTYLRTTIRDLLSIEPMPPPNPADEGKVESPADTIARLTRERDEWKAKYDNAIEYL